AGAQTITTTTYHHLTLSGGGTKSAGAAVAVNGDLTISNGVTFDGGTFSHSLKGNWINNGTFTPGTSTVQFIGVDDASVSGATTFNGLTVNKSSSSNILVLNNNVSATSVTMTSGRMLTGSNTLTITSTRSGNGIIIGTITRTHAFSDGISYAFEGPNNTINF